MLFEKPVVEIQSKKDRGSVVSNGGAKSGGDH